MEYLDLSNRIYPFIFLLIAVIFIAIGGAVYLRKKPIVLPSRAMFGLVLLCLLPSLISSVLINRMAADMSAEMSALQWLVPAMLLILLGFMWVQMQGYVMIGITDDSFRKALVAELQAQGQEYQEELSRIVIPASGLEVQVAIQSWMGVGQFKCRTKAKQAEFIGLINGLKQRLNAEAMEINPVTSIFYIVIGIIMFAFAIFMIRLSGAA
jgi:hypothetical protein